MASLTNGFKYDVFLSFKAEDTSSDFASSLCKALNDRGILTFMDDNKKLENGEKLFKTIKESKTAIIVLSKNYASSLSCLEQLASILDCMKEKRRLVWPVFYNVDPSSVQRKIRTGKLMGIYKAWSNHYKKRLKKTKKALHQVADLSGFHLNNGDAGSELELIERIVKEVSRELKLDSYSVEMQSQMKEVNSLLELGSDEVLMAGIYGMKGMNKSKTALARAVYNMIADQFESSCYLDDVSENSNKHGLEHLQNMLLSEIGEEDIWFGNAYKGVSIIKQMLHNKKVLLVLDDVDTIEQLEFLVGGTDWFGSGSRVIITTWDKHLLAFHGVERRYEIQELRLETVGAYFPGLFGIGEGEARNAIDDKEIQMLLKAKFDALGEDKQSIFLDIVCCFKGYELIDVQRILCAQHGYNVKDQIEVFIYEHLLSISDGKVTILDSVEKMGKELVRRESPTEPGNRSRLWLPEDIIYVLKENTGSSKVEIIHLDFPSTEDEEVKVIDCDEEAFKNMINLKTLIIRRCHFSKAPKHLPNSLRVLEWKTYPSEELPSNFDAKQLHICKLLNMDFMSPMLIKGPRVVELQSGVEVSQTSNWDFRTLLTSKRVFNANIMWRLVGIVSSVIGLLCYALNPSFNRLIGKWNFLKVFLYGAFSLAILTTFIKQFSVSPSTQYAKLKTYISFAILIIISIYSIYYDKAVNGKPGILNLVSNAAFALMSLSFSKLMKFGFEVGIFAYFLGCFAIQLWTINWMLILVAIIFGCPLFVMHLSSHSQEEFDNRDQIIDESSGSDPEVGNAGQPDVGNGSQVITDSYLQSQQEASRNGHVIHGSSSDTIPEVAGSQDDVDIILEANSISVVAL